MGRSVLFCIAAGFLLSGVLPVEAQEVDFKAKVQAINESINRAKELVREKKFQELGALVVSTETAIDELAAADSQGDFKTVVTRLKRQIATYRKTAERNGIELPKPDETAAVSFVKEVAPIFVNRCGGCHVRNMRGMFSMATIESLLAGPPAGPVVKPGKSVESRLVQLVSEGEMPPNGTRIPEEEIAVLVKWVDGGARFDGDNRMTPLLELVPQAGQPERPMLSVARATGSEKVLFSRDIAPVLVDNCIECHGDQNPRAQLGLDTFQRLLRGGDTGLAIEPGEPDESLLVRKLKGLAGDRMPLNRPALSDDLIEKFATWISEGAKFDGSSETETVVMLANVYQARVMTFDELARKRLELARQNWKLAVPDEAAGVFEAPRFAVVGNVSQGELGRVAEAAARQEKEVARMLRAPSSEPLFKGRLTVFAFKSRFDYQEFSRMVEQRDLGDEVRGHYFFNVVDAYGCLVPPKTGSDDSAADDALACLLSSQIAGAYLESLGTVPRWFSQGGALAVSSKLVPKDPAVLRLRDRLPEAMRNAPSAEAVITGDASVQDLPALQLSFVEFLMSSPSQFTALLKSLKVGTEFQAALARAYRADAKALAMAWAKNNGWSG
jgi:mono/diheme cytochrome c family protein